MTILEIISVCTSILSLATSCWLISMLREKDLLIDKLILVINSETAWRIEPAPYLIDRLEKLIKDK